MMRFAIALASAGLLISGCRPTTVGDALAKAAAPKNAQRKESGTQVLELRYVPKSSQLLANRGFDPQTRLSKSILDSLAREQPVGGLMFILRIEPRDTSMHPDFRNDVVYGGSSGFGGYQESLAEYQFGLKEKIWIESGGRKIPLTNSQFENSYGMTVGRLVVLHFPLPEPEAGEVADLKIVLDDISPGLGRWKSDWRIPVGAYD